MAAVSRAAFHCLSAASTKLLRRKCKGGCTLIDRERGAALDRGAPFVQLRELALRGKKDRADRTARGAHLGKLRLEVGRPSGERGIDEFVERQRRSVGHHRGNIVDVDFAAAAGVQRELAKLVARSRPVAAEQRNEHGACVGLERQPGGAHLAVDQPPQIALGIGVAGQRRSVFGAFAQHA